MPTYNVIQGTGQPRIIVEDNVTSLDNAAFTYNVSQRLLLSNVVSNPDLSALNLDRVKGSLIGKQVIIYKPATNEVCAFGKIVSFTANSILVDDWMVPKIGVYDPAIDSSCRLRIQNRIIDLPYCEELKEYFKEDSIEHQLFKGEIVVELRGFWYRATLGYDTYASKDLVESLQSIFDINRANMYFYPRKDNANVFYKADLEKGSELTLAQLKNHAGHRFVNISLRGLKRLDKLQLKIKDPEGYGDCYGGSMTAGYGEVL